MYAVGVRVYGGEYLLKDHYGISQVGSWYLLIIIMLLCMRVRVQCLRTRGV